MSLILGIYSKLNVFGKASTPKVVNSSKGSASVSAVATPVLKAAAEAPRSQSAPPTLSSSPPSPPCAAAAMPALSTPPSAATPPSPPPGPAAPALSVFDKAAKEDGAGYDPRSEAEKQDALRLDAKPAITAAAPPPQALPVKETITAWQNTPTYGLLKSIVPDQISPKKKLEEVHGTYIWFVTTAQMLRDPTYQPSTPSEIAIQKRLKHIPIPKGAENWTLTQFRAHLESEKQVVNAGYKKLLMTSG